MAASDRRFDSPTGPKGRRYCHRHADKQLKAPEKLETHPPVSDFARHPYMLMNLGQRDEPSSSRHLVKTLREDEKGMRALDRLKFLRGLSVKVDELRPYAAGSPALSDFLRLWDDDLVRVLAPRFSKPSLADLLATL